MVPAGIGEEVQAASAADDLGGRRERLAVREHDPVFTGRLGAVGTDLGQGEPVIVGAVAAEQRNPRARRG